MKPSRKLLCAAITSVLSAGSAHAVITVDGINTGGTQYTVANTQAWDFYSTHDFQKDEVIHGALSWSEDTTNDVLYLLLSAPINYVDNVYGAEALDPLYGWFPDAPSKHPYKDLLGSDKLVAHLDLDGNGSIVDGEKLTVDYIDDADKAALEKKNTYTGTVYDVASSLEYNLSLSGSPCGVSGDSATSTITGAGCVSPDRVIQGMADGSGSQVHASKNKTYSEPPEEVPEPSTLALLLAGFPGVLWARRRKRIRKQ